MRLIDADAAIEAVCEEVMDRFFVPPSAGYDVAEEALKKLPSVQPERKIGYWILDRSGAYCCNRCMEPCATYAMMKPRDKFCKMCGSRNEVME